QSWIKIAAHDFARLHEFRFPQEFAVTQPADVAPERDTSAVGLNFVEVALEIDIGRIDGYPQTQRGTTDQWRFVRQRVGVINQSVLADAQCESLVDCGGFFFRVDALNVLAATCIQWIVNKGIRAIVRLFFVQRTRAKDSVSVSILRIEVKGFWIRSQRLKVVGVFPFAIRA